MAAFQTRRCRRGDCAALVTLFRDTVRQVNLRDYTPEQVAAWAPDDIDEAAWTTKFTASFTVVGETAEGIVGFANLTDDGTVDMMFCHRDWQGKGVASALLAKLEAHAVAAGHATITTEASITALPFFERRGFRVFARQEVEKRGETLVNFRMEKTIRQSP